VFTRSVANTATVLPSSSPAEITMLTCIPATNEPDTSAPKTATARGPPACLLALNSAPASPACAGGSVSFCPFRRCGPFRPVSDRNGV
jgi:hypothetical protein